MSEIFLKSVSPTTAPSIDTKKEKFRKLSPLVVHKEVLTQNHPSRVNLKPYISYECLFCLV